MPLKDPDESAKNVLRYFAGNAARLDFTLDTYSNQQDVIRAIGRISYLGENTNMTGGLRVARQQVFESAAAGGQRPGIGRVIALITDGEPTREVDKLYAEATTIKNSGIRIVALGVTNKVSIYTRPRYNTTIILRVEIC